jgi:L-alanine-DL-glutamate epimerase-like enolase superfamily enzyme
MCPFAPSDVAAAIEKIDVAAFEIPTDSPESDGTYEWKSTTLVVVEARAGGEIGFGYTYAAGAAARLIREKFAPAVEGVDALAVPLAWRNIVSALRNLGRPGLGSMALSAVDAALWDLKAKLMQLPLATLLGAVRDAAPIYGSGGFTSYSIDKLREQLGGWSAQGIHGVKMKVGREPREDPRRVAAAREAIGPEVGLFVDANGAYSRKQALALAEAFAEQAVSWFEEPVSSDDLGGLRLLCDRAPPGMEIAAGEYGYDLFYFRRMLAAGAVDVLQVDATRAGGVTGFLQAAALAAAFGLDVSAHCAPSLHVHPCCALANVRPLEYFHDHARIERMLFDGAIAPDGGELRFDKARPGLGIEFKRRDAERYAI